MQHAIEAAFAMLAGQSCNFHGNDAPCLEAEVICAPVCCVLPVGIQGSETESKPAVGLNQLAHAKSGQHEGQLPSKCRQAGSA